jgi:hypothetical protein
VRAILLALITSSTALLAEDSKIEISLPTDNDALFRRRARNFINTSNATSTGEIDSMGGWPLWLRPQSGADGTGLIYTASMRESTFAACIATRGVNLWMMSGQLPTAELFIPIRCRDIQTTDVTLSSSMFGTVALLQPLRHLSEIVVNVGQRVNRGERIARMGYSGEGLNQARAHLHLELNLMFNRNFESWHDRFFVIPITMAFTMELIWPGRYRAFLPRARKAA